MGLRARILTVLGAASLSAPLAHCDRASTADTTGSAGGGGGSSSIQDAGAYDGDGLLAPVTECFDGQGRPCPTDPQVALGVFAQYCNGLTVAEVISGPAAEGSECCYLVVDTLCTSAPGRLYLVGGTARTADPIVSEDAGWTGPPSPHADALSTEARAYLGAAWTRDALVEHASVASFARLTLSLLGLGAPADLLAEAQRAALDEVQHAALCFSLASTYAGHPVGPAPFPLEPDLDVPRSLVALAVATVREGCVGELVAAATASAQLERATDPAVRAALTRIATDEARHAEFAWRTVAWAIARGGTAVRDAVAAAFAEASTLLNEAEALPACIAHEVAAHGRLERATALAVIAGTLTDVVRPCARALIATSRDGVDERRGSLAGRA